MKTNNLIILVLVVIIIILAFLIVYPFVAPNNTIEVTGNSTTPEDNLTINATADDVVNATLEDDSPKQYDDWQKDYETGEYDEYGSPIYRSVISTSGGQNEPGIYEAYWSENGPISEERIG